MRNGLRKQSVGIYTVQVSQDSTGEYAETGTTLVRTVWAMARKLEAKGQVLSTQSIPDPKWTFEFQFADASDLTIEHRLVYNGRSFDVLDVDDVMERRHVVRALCSQRRESAYSMPSNLLVYWKINEGTGQFLRDESGNNYGGIVGSDFSDAVRDPAWVSTTGGGTALRFSTDTRVTTTDAAALLPDAFTVCAAVKLSSASAMSYLLSWAGDTPAINLAGQFSSYRPLLYMGSANFRYFDRSPVDLQDTAWHFVSFTCPGSSSSDIASATLRIDGQDIAAISTTQSGAQTTKSLFRLGEGSTVQAEPNCDVGFFAMFSDVLTTSEQDAVNQIARTYVPDLPSIS